LCREEASQISSLKPQLDNAGVPIYGLVHENMGTEVQDFSKFFKGEIFLDRKRSFFMGYLGLLRGLIKPSVWSSVNRAKAGGFEGNMKGEGRYLGGVYLFGPRNQGLVYHHEESEWGDHAKVEDVSEAIKKIQKNA